MSELTMRIVMPLWKIYHPAETWSARLARRIAYEVGPLLGEYAGEGMRRDRVLRWGEQDIDLASRRAVANTITEIINERLAATA